MGVVSGDCVTVVRGSAGANIASGTFDLNQMALILSQFTPHNVPVNSGQLATVCFRRIPWMTKNQ
jgi:hypothetical protein